MIFTIIPKSWFSWNFRIMAGDRRVAEIETSLMSEKGRLSVEGMSYQAYREGMLHGAFVLDASGTVLARAEKPSALFRSFVLEHGGKSYTLAARKALKREFVLNDGESEIGTMAPAGAFTRRAVAELPEELPLPVQVFIVWLVLLMWRRESDDDA